ncbi:MAG: FAD/NAD(P)-binding oxidoreductase, partial [Carnobacterium sp.]
MHIVIVGGSFAGVTAALTARKKFEKATITLLEKEGNIGFVPGALHGILNGTIKNVKEAYFITVEEVEKRNIQVQLDSTVENMDTSNRQLTYRKLDKLAVISYDKLILATGSVQNS